MTLPFVLPECACKIKNGYVQLICLVAISSTSQKLTFEETASGWKDAWSVMSDKEHNQHFPAVY